MTFFSIFFIVPMGICLLMFIRLMLRHFTTKTIVLVLLAAAGLAVFGFSAVTVREVRTVSHGPARPQIDNPFAPHSPMFVADAELVQHSLHDTPAERFQREHVIGHWFSPLKILFILFVAFCCLIWWIGREATASAQAYSADPALAPANHVTPQSMGSRFLRALGRTMVTCLALFGVVSIVYLLSGRTEQISSVETPPMPYQEHGSDVFFDESAVQIATAETIPPAGETTTLVAEAPESQGSLPAEAVAQTASNGASNSAADEDDPEKNLPAWAVRASNYDHAVVKVGPYSTKEECRRWLETQLQDAVNDHAVEFFGSPRTAHAGNIPLSFIYQKVAPMSGDENVYFQERGHSFGKMYTMYVKLDFSRPEVRQSLVELQQRQVVNQRMTIYAFVMAAVLGLVGTVFSYLKLDTATRGYYTKRLQFLAIFVGGGLLLATVWALAELDVGRWVLDPM